MSQNGNDGSHAYSYSEFRITTKNTSKPQIGCTTTSGSTTTVVDCSTIANNTQPSSTVGYFINYGSTTQAINSTTDELTNGHCNTLVNGACTPDTGNSGTWYNHTAATAGSSMGDFGSPRASGTAEDSICPKGWMLPTYDGNKSYYNLIINVYGGIEIANISNSQADEYILNNPLSFFRSGHYRWESASRSYRGSRGNYWESHIASNTYSNYLGFTSTNLAPQRGNNRGYGFSVRCVSSLTR